MAEAVGFVDKSVVVDVLPAVDEQRG